MPITVNCHCGAQFRVRDEYAGKKAQCPTCGDAVVIPLADGSPAAGFPPSSYHTAPESTSDYPGIQTSYPGATAARHGGGQWFAGLDSGLFGMGRLSGLACLLVGLVFVLMARGCDALANRSAVASKAKYSLAQTEFTQEWEDKRNEVEAEIDDLQETIDELNQKLINPETPSAAQRFQEDLTQAREDQDEERKKLSDLQKDERKARREKDRGEWRNLRVNADSAMDKNSLWRYWRELLFVFGTIVLSVGLLTVGFTGEPHERRICLIMITIITFSIYVGGIAWIDSLITSVASTANAIR